MSEILLFHHVLGLTKGVHTFAEHLRQAGHTVHTPDLFQGQTFATLDEGIHYAEQVGFKTLEGRAVRIADELPRHLVYAGFSLGVMPAQKLAQTRTGALGALFFHGCLPPEAYGAGWPTDLPVQIHAMDADPWFAEDKEAAQVVVHSASNGHLFMYPGDKHLFTDCSLAAYDSGATSLLMERVLAFLARL
ncbi:Putative dienelactone hydrolase [Deinococcus deserti]|uniref:Putative dienelactone hydrolase n=1 Tax=Deinococcus deserti (strain DSM 17065 / CIP 109153 / LMG 22923 / VCD115) TaxID=546414 RepID=C1D3Z1_DEIDV|nr:putative dienelactone hydrolase [Deinococcus deserti VCD115]